MAVIISNGATSLNTPNGFYRVEASNLGCYNNTSLALTTARTIDITFANAGDCQGIVLYLWATAMTSRQVVVSLQENTGSWVTRATTTLSVTDIAGSVTSGTFAYRGQYLVPVVFSSPYTVDISAGKWRFDIRHGTGTGTWNLSTSNGTAPFYATWCNNAVSFTDDDILICKDKVIVDKTASTGAVLGTGDSARGTSVIVCSNTADPTPSTMAYLEWQNVPASSYTLTVKGQLLTANYSGIRIGKEESATVAISNGNPAVISKTAHGLVAGQMISFETTGTLPSPLVSTRGHYYYVSDASDPDSFTISATAGGAEIETTTDGSGVHTLLWGRIPIAQKAVLTFTAPAVGTDTTGFSSRGLTVAYDYGGRASLFFYGQKPKIAKTNLSADASIGQAKLLTTENVDWVNGDQVVVGKQDVQGQGVTTVHTVSSVSGAEITLTTNLATNVRKAGGTVLKLSGYGVEIQNTSTFSVNSIYNPANFVLSGVRLYNFQFTSAGTSYYPYLSALDPQYRSAYLVEDSIGYTNSSSSVYLLRNIIPPDGMTIRRFHSFRTTIIQQIQAYFVQGFISGRVIIHDCATLGQYSNGIAFTGTNNPYVSIYNCDFENSRTSPFIHYLRGRDSEFYNNNFYGANSVNGAVYVGQYINPLKIENNTYNNNLVGMTFGEFASKNCIDVDSSFGNEQANTTDLSWTEMGGSLPDYTFDNVSQPVGGLVIDETYLPEMVDGGKVGFTNADGVPTNDRTIFTYGKLQRTNASLADTTVRTAGGSAMRFAVTTAESPFDFYFDTPTGNIKDKTMAVAVWCKIKHANYWAGTNTMPTLRVQYDGFTYTSAVATKTTDWQLLAVNFTPTTTTSKITVHFEVKTDAPDTDRYVYFDDCSVLYPAGVQLNLGGFDVWSNAMPVLPPISTNIAALDIWGLSTSIDFGTGSIGNFVKKLLSTAKFIGLK